MRKPKISTVSFVVGLIIGLSLLIGISVANTSQPPDNFDKQLQNQERLIQELKQINKNMEEHNRILRDIKRTLDKRLRELKQGG